MTNSLEAFIAATKAAWGPLSSELIEACSQQLDSLLKAPNSEDWLSSLHQVMPANEELYRDLSHGFMLLAHAEQAGLYRPPHDHGRGWVIYAVQAGEIEMGSYARMENAHGEVRLVKRDSTLVRAGQVKVYLPGDIHDTQCMSASALLYRFTDRDLRVEAKEGRLTRYVELDDAWAVGPK